MRYIMRFSCYPSNVPFICDGLQTILEVMHGCYASLINLRVCNPDG